MHETEGEILFSQAPKVGRKERNQLHRKRRNFWRWGSGGRKSAILDTLKTWRGRPWALHQRCALFSLRGRRLFPESWLGTWGMCQRCREREKRPQGDRSGGLLARLGSDGFAPSICVLVSSLKPSTMAWLSVMQWGPVLYITEGGLTRKLERRQTIENSARYIHGMGWGETKWDCRKVFKELSKKLFSDLSQTAWKIIIWGSSSIVSVGGDAWRKRKCVLLLVIF